jgi:uncharacterized protein (DUF433 family)
MNVKALLDRIFVGPAILVGQSAVRGTRIPVSLIVNYINHGQGVEELLDEYPNLIREDVEAAIAYHQLPAERHEVRAL